jgi:hypothetical protein
VADIRGARAIAARVQEVWDVLADFGSIISWADNVDHSCILFSGPDGRRVGTARRVQVNRDALVECITEFDPSRTIAASRRPPSPSPSMLARWFPRS